MRVGKIVDVSVHPDAESLYVSKIDLGEEQPRTIVSGLVKYIPIEEMKGRQVVVLCNLKPAKLRGIESNGMVLCCKIEEEEKLETLAPPADAAPGERILIENYEDGKPDEVLNPKKKVWEKLSVDLKTNADCVAQWQGNNLLTKSGGKVTTKAIPNCLIR